jgi:uncharacterized membrane protein
MIPDVTLHLIAYVAPFIILVLAIPLLAGIVPPNRWYGFRTPKTRSSREIWRKANRVSALCLIGAVVLSWAFNAALRSARSDWPESSLVAWMAGSVIVAVLLAALCSVTYVRRL